MKPIHIPTEEQESVRDFVRCRFAIRKDVVRAKHRAIKMLDRKGRLYRGNVWTTKHRVYDVPSKARRRAILRRDGYCCAVPGCPNTLWLEVHHMIFYANGGLTRPENLITICSKCHKNVHEGRLVIHGNAPHGARFLNEWGRDLRVERTLDTAYWLDIWCGWRGTTLDRRYHRAREFREAAG